MKRIVIIGGGIAGLGAACKSKCGLALAGNAYCCAGVPNALESGERAVSKVLAEAGISLAEDSVEERRVY